MSGHQNPISAIASFKSDPAVRSLVMKHSSLQTWRTVVPLVLDWAIIAVAVAASSWVTANSESRILAITFYIFSAVVIACRQHALLVMMHEAAHFRISKNQKLNDFLGSYFAAFPTLSTLSGYRKHHVQHHRETNTDNDPDWARKLHLPDWQYPQRQSMIARVFLKQFYRGGWDWLQFMSKIGKEDVLRVAFWGCVLLVSAVFDGLREVALFWMVPLVFIFPFIQRVRSTAEHFGLPNEHELNGTRNVLAGTLETFLFSPHCVNLHLTHHLFPSVPFYRLQSLHNELMKSETYAQLGYTNDSFLFGPRSVLFDLKTRGTHLANRTAEVEAA